MFRLMSLSCGLLLTSWSLSADDPKAKEQKKPPFERLLKGNDAKHAEGLKSKLEEREAKDEISEAMQLAEHLLNFRKKVQGEDHWETVDQQLVYEEIETIARMSKEDRVGWRKAKLGHVKTQQFLEEGQYDQSFPLAKEYQKWCIKIFGEEHTQTATSYDTLANLLLYQGRSKEAQPLHEKALDIRRKKLGEDHPTTAISFANLASNLDAQAKSREAQPLYEKSLAIFRKVLGEEHPKTIGGYNQVASNLQLQAKYSEAQKIFEKVLTHRIKLFGENHADTAMSYNNLAMNLDAQGKAREAQPFYEKTLAIFRIVFHPDHPNIAGISNNLAYNLNAQGKYAEAEPLYQKALDIFRRLLGENHPNTATCYDNLALNFNAQGKSGEAGPIFQKALDIRRNVLGEEHPDTAASYNNLALGLNAQGKYGEANALYQIALGIHRRTLGNEHPLTLNNLNNIATNLDEQGKSKEAQAILEKVLELRQRVLGENHPLTAESYQNLALNLNDQSKYEEAQIKFLKALEIRRKASGEDHRDTATSYNNLALNLTEQGKLDEAQALYQRALDSYRKAFGEEHPFVGKTYLRMALNLNALEKYQDAQIALEKAIAIYRKVFGEEHPDMTSMYSRLAMRLKYQEKYPEALVQAKQAVRSYEASRINIASKGLDRASFGQRESPYRFLASLQAKKQDFPAAFEALEYDLARGLLDEIASQRSNSLDPSDQRLQKEWTSQYQTLQSQVLLLSTRLKRTESEQKELERILKQRTQLGTQLADLAAKIAQREVASLKEIQKNLPTDVALLTWVDVSSRGVEDHWGCLLRAEGKPIFEALLPIDPRAKWTKADSQLPTLLIELLQNRNRDNELQVVKKQLYSQRLAPFEKYLDGIRQLYVVNTNAMAGIPLEVLTDKYTISYLPSGTFLTRLKNQPLSKASQVLALGDPFFPSKEKTKESPLPSSGLLITQVLPQGNAAKARIQANDVLLKYAGTELKSLDQLPKLVEANAQANQIDLTIWREGKVLDRKVDPGRLGVVLDRQSAPEALLAKRKADQMLASLRSDWGELPGTAVEIDRLKSLFGEKTQILTRKAATEKNLEELRQADKLKEFRYLHFATHGQANNEKAFESALILSPLNLSKEPRVGEKFYNGELSAKEVLEDWKLDAELITLSACESGLGRKGGGDGLLGFAQAFLKAGARSVCLSLWRVDDSATALLMDRFYQNLLGKREGLTKPMAKAMALQEAKNWLKNLTLEEATKLSADISNGVARGKEKGVKLVIPKTEAKVENAKQIKPFEHPRYWAAFILIGDPN